MAYIQEECSSVKPSNEQRALASKKLTQSNATVSDMHNGKKLAVLELTQLLSNLPLQYNSRYFDREKCCAKSVAVISLIKLLCIQLLGLNSCNVL